MSENFIQTIDPTDPAYQALHKRIRNETIDELCNWLQSCINQIDHSTAGDHEVYKACTAMVDAMRNKKG